MSGFAYAAIQAGWRWIIAGFGNSAFAITCGLATIIGFIYLAWKFAFVAFGVIADLFLGIMMLPFTAIAETVGKTSHETILVSSTDATCTSVGVKNYKCKNCTHTYSEESGIKSHSYSAATCTVAKTCGACGKTDGTKKPRCLLFLI